MKLEVNNLYLFMQLIIYDMYDMDGMDDQIH